MTNDVKVWAGNAAREDYGDVCAAVVASGGRGTIYADGRLTVPMLVALYRRYEAAFSVVGGAFAADTSTFVRGDGGQSFDTLCDQESLPRATPVHLFTFESLGRLASEVNSNDRWDFDVKSSYASQR